ncbi:MAG: bifunctional glycosyltransferase family 2/GtrA family protein [Firmicutes bacterium]|nr:bifunctional glycosyltransferase family 2/GtrA family protein [Bacillota bacterium]
MDNKALNVAILIPAYNPPPALIDYVEQLIASGAKRILIVNDGSAPEYEPTFSRLEENAFCTVLRHPANQGKGAALKTGFRYYLQHYCDSFRGVVMADADGQHRIEDILHIESLLQEDAGEIILGCRDFDLPEVPWRSRFGNGLSGAVFRFLYGGSLRDTQTGLRGLPNKQLTWISELPGNRFEYEINMLIYCRKRNVALREVPISTIYFDNNAGSHFRTFRDVKPIFLALMSGLFEYAFSAICGGVVDLGIFLLLNAMLSDMPNTGLRLAISLSVARICSSIPNFLLNHRRVFDSQRRKRSSAPRYYCLWLAQLTAAWILVWLGERTLPLHVGWIKIIVDFILMIISYQIQLRWVFAKQDVERSVACS